jgi:hypothetical protein
VLAIRRTKVAVAPPDKLKARTSPGPQRRRH